MEEEKKVRKPKKMRKLEKKINKLTEKNNITPKKSIEKKLTKLEKKKVKLEKWLKIKLPFRILIKGVATWLIIGGVCYGCSYVPVVREVKMVTMAAIAYVAPEPVAKVLDVVTLNVGASNNDFEWLKTTLKAYMNGEIQLETTNDGSREKTGSSGFEIRNDDGTVISSEYTYYLDGKEVSEAEYKKQEAEWKKNNQELQEKSEQLAQDVFGTVSADEISTMSISEILMKVATNSTPEIVSQLLDMIDLTDESRQRVEQDINRALKILKKLNNNQMNELVEIINNVINQNTAENQIIAEVQNVCQNFIEEVRTAGKITKSNYNTLVSNLNSMGSYEIELEIKALDDNLGTTTAIGENIYYSIYTMQIIEEINRTGTKNMMQGDIISINVKSTNQIVGQYSGMVTVNGK